MWRLYVLPALAAAGVLAVGVWAMGWGVWWTWPW